MCVCVCVCACVCGVSLEFTLSYTSTDIQTYIQRKQTCQKVTNTRNILSPTTAPALISGDPIQCAARSPNHLPDAIPIHGLDDPAVCMHACPGCHHHPLGHDYTSCASLIPLCSPRLPFSFRIYRQWPRARRGHPAAGSTPSAASHRTQPAVLSRMPKT